MGIDTTQAHDHPSTNALDAIPDDLLDLPTPPAYLAFGTTPSGMEAPPEIDEVGIYVIRARCVGASTSERTDGELRHGRKLQIQWCIKQGQPEPPDAEQEQPGLFDEDEDRESDAEQEGADAEVDRPEFSGVTE
ncbi:MAG: hypothetical protein KAZ48_11250 [Candidatus Nanopelagicales bacterium]|jgi:hypothetical protein|nr:hypothetical protein [Candidatus Nanopelagicales bacterium]